MSKPYTIVEHNDYKLTIYGGIAPFDPNNDNVDVEVTFTNGDSFSAVFFTKRCGVKAQFFRFGMKHRQKTLILLKKCDILFRHRCGGLHLSLESATAPFEDDITM